MWFEVANTELFCFAGIWRPTVEGERFAFLTTDANRDVDAKAMPVIPAPADYQRWLGADYATACGLQKPLDDGALRLRAAPIT